MPRWLKPRRKPEPVCVPLIEDGRVLAYVHTAGPLTDHDRAALDRFHQILTDQHRHDQEATST